MNPTSRRRTIAGPEVREAVLGRLRVPTACPVNNWYVAFVHIFSVQQPAPTATLTGLGHENAGNGFHRGWRR